MALKIRRNPTAILINVRIEISEDKKWISEIIITKCLVLDSKVEDLANGVGGGVRNIRDKGTFKRHSEWLSDISCTGRYKSRQASY